MLGGYSGVGARRWRHCARRVLKVSSGVGARRVLTKPALSRSPPGPCTPSAPRTLPRPFMKAHSACEYSDCGEPCETGTQWVLGGCSVVISGFMKARSDCEYAYAAYACRREPGETVVVRWQPGPPSRRHAQHVGTAGSEMWRPPFSTSKVTR